VIVAGAGGGLGRAYARHAASEGAAVVVNDIALASAEQVVVEITEEGGQAVASGHSVAEWSDAADLVALCRREFGRVDGLVNNAGVISLRAPADEDEASLRHVVGVNLLGALFVGTHALRHMVAVGSGSIVNITSSSQMGIRGQGAYGATKGALASLTYSWALDLAGAGVRVNAYSPLAATPMSANAPALVTDLPTSEDNAAVVSYLLSDVSSPITGQVVKREGRELIVMGHPSLTDARADADGWNLAQVLDLFDPVLRAREQPIGAPGRDSVQR
jgi:NAD(P)-dependent dehydrogenase (short-subunit alcohol dehydrogenase family)